MKHIRLFPSASIRDAVLAEIEHGVISYTEGEGMLLKTVAASPQPTVDPSTPFYIDVRSAVTLAATSGFADEHRR